MLEYEEKRDFVRMQTNCRITYKFPGSETVHEGVCLNLSGAGVLFRATERIDNGRALEIKIVADNALTPPLIAYVEVIRSMVSESEEGGFEIAGAIKGIKGS